MGSAGQLDACGLASNLPFYPSIGGRRVPALGQTGMKATGACGAPSSLILPPSAKVDSPPARTPSAPPHQTPSWRRFRAQSINVFKKHDGAFLLRMFVFMTFSLLACLYMCGEKEVRF